MRASKNQKMKNLPKKKRTPLKKNVPFVTGLGTFFSGGVSNFFPLGTPGHGLLGFNIKYS
jgi:hypothetical protein